MTTQNNFNQYSLLGLAVFLSISVVVFETAQQLFYINLYQISADATFSTLFFSQTRKWLVWIIFAIPLWFFMRNLAAKDNLSSQLFFSTMGFIALLLALVILTISVVEISLAGQALTAERLWQDFYTFYAFQKVPIYSFGFTLLAVIFYLHAKNNQLTVQVLKLSQLNQKDLHQYYKNQATKDQNAAVLKIKVGHKYKILPVEDIEWIEADDYCVNIHSSSHDMVYSMRATLKSLEASLPDTFLRVHRSAIVNMQGVEEYKSQGSGLIKMKNGDEIAVAQSKMKLVNDFYAPQTPSQQ